MTQPHCLFCNSKSLTPSKLPPTNFNGKFFEYPKCIECDLVFLSPLPNSDDLNHLYSPQYHHADTSNEINIRNHSKAIELLRRRTYCKVILDFGCGNGEFVQQAIQAGYTCIGAEYNPKQIEKLRQKIPEGNFIQSQDLDHLYDSSFDAIYLGDVLEHLPNPRSTLQFLLSKLKPSGYLLIEGPIESNPNLAYFLRNSYFASKKKLLKHRFVANHPPYHILFSNHKNQLNLFESVPLKTLEYNVYEVSWPYPSQISQVKSIPGLLKYAIGKTSMISSKFIKNWGNRFIYLGQI